jgi:hypothetical protein
MDRYHFHAWSSFAVWANLCGEEKRTEVAGKKTKTKNDSEKAIDRRKKDLR